MSRYASQRWVSLGMIVLVSTLLSASRLSAEEISSPTAAVYGYVKFDLAYDTSRAFPGNYVFYVLSEPDNHRDDNQLNITANQTRLGLNILGPDFPGGKSSGKVELDFYGGGPENKSLIMMRQAYLEMTWPENDFSLLAGQTSDLMGQIFPDTVNYSVCWMAGNIGYRRPQVRVSKGFAAGANSKLTARLALARTIGDATALSGGDTGEDAGIPTLQCALEYTLPLLTEKSTLIRLAGHWGKEEYDTDATNQFEEIPTHSISLDLDMPLTSHLKLKLKLWQGANLDAYLGGIYQGVSADLEAIKSKGGWFSLALGPVGISTFNVGASLDVPQYDQLAAGDKQQNGSLFANVFFALNSAIKAGIELSQFRTLYVEQDDGDTIRFQTALIYSF